MFIYILGHFQVSLNTEAGTPTAFSLEEDRIKLVNKNMQKLENNW